MEGLPATAATALRVQAADPGVSCRASARYVCQLIYRLCRPFRGLARSHRYCTVLKSCGVPVGAGKPAKGPAQATPTSPDNRPQPCPPS
ncbi:hypothetical protein CXG50_22080 [Pseudomonas plecoglossicida]|uniref:Uncharacterized protein n=1 Tax=Pseudomonas plecoglossicida TaxID=70775 RepID=A0ABX4U7V8_PSEDL|nr:hypothetical protein CX682_24085 [Pseudomonas sp. FFUP_PS_41]PLU88864.1 hypothetical protein CXG44_03945 [Pseudomonas plecoglossicida]TXI07388.1 MAG: hypothetical protein E6Q70_05300 [Pseudomonas monteilii]PLU95040.1 hypothetical protein CXG45_03150 [Pseudomonas plecoglossicida]PLU96046.1 hypothetical protein CXG52_20755 [Pseudomonas plecoglossicida]